MNMKKFIAFCLLIIAAGTNAMEHFVESKADSSNRVQKTKDCVICLESKTETNFVKLECGHTFCKECLNRALEVCFREKNTNELKCPDVNCKNNYTERDVRNITDNAREKLELFSTIKAKEWLTTEQGIKHCPTANCPYSFINEDNNNVRTTCPSCNKTYCSNCLVNHDQEISCENARKAKENDETFEKWKNENTKNCPQCQTVIQRDGGCNTIRCSRCEHAFCWYCLGAYDHQHHVCRPVGPATANRQDDPYWQNYERRMLRRENINHQIANPRRMPQRQGLDHNQRHWLNREQLQGMVNQAHVVLAQIREMAGIFAQEPQARELMPREQQGQQHHVQELFIDLRRDLLDQLYQAPMNYIEIVREILAQLPLVPLQDFQEFLNEGFRDIQQIEQRIPQQYRQAFLIQLELGIIIMTLTIIEQHQQPLVLEQFMQDYREREQRELELIMRERREQGQRERERLVRERQEQEQREREEQERLQRQRLERERLDLLLAQRLQQHEQRIQEALDRVREQQEQARREQERLEREREEQERSDLLLAQRIYQEEVELALQEQRQRDLAEQERLNLELIERERQDAQRREQARPNAPANNPRPRQQANVNNRRRQNQRPAPNNAQRRNQARANAQASKNKR